MCKPVRTIEISEKLDTELRQLADANGLKPAELIERALNRYRDDVDDITEDERPWAQFERDGKFVTGEAVKAWIESWGTPDEFPMPKP